MASGHVSRAERPNTRRTDQCCTPAKKSSPNGSRPHTGQRQLIVPQGLVLREPCHVISRRRRRIYSLAAAPATVSWINKT